MRYTSFLYYCRNVLTLAILVAQSAIMIESRTRIPTYETVVKTLQEKLSYLEEKVVVSRNIIGNSSTVQHKIIKIAKKIIDIFWNVHIFQDYNISDTTSSSLINIIENELPMLMILIIGLRNYLQADKYFISVSENYKL